MPKLTDLTNVLVTTAPGDLLHIVDVSDPTDDPAGSSKKITVGNLISAVPNANKELLTVSSNGQTAFTLSVVPASDISFSLLLNGIEYAIEGTHYSRVGTALTWLDPDGLTLVTTDEFLAIFGSTGAASAVTSVFGRSGVVVAAVNDYDASEVNNDSGVTGATVKDALETNAAAIAALPDILQIQVFS